MAAQRSSASPSGLAKCLGLCGLESLLAPKKGNLIPLCAACERKEDTKFRFLTPAVQRTWVWNSETQSFTCIKCFTKKRKEDRERKQMLDKKKKQEEEKKSELQERAMKRLPSGKRWERTESFTEKYREPEHVRTRVEKALEDPKNSGEGRTLPRKGSAAPKSTTEWTLNLDKENIVRHPSEGTSHYAGEDAVEGFQPHAMGSTIAEEGDSDAESPKRQGGNAWVELSSSGLVDATVSEVVLEEGDSDSSGSGPSPFDD
eukprot:jgi/Tetstr1/462896/TSEL_007845.t1